MREPKLRNLVNEICTGQRLNAEAAVKEAIRRLAEVFSRLQNPYVRERAADLHEVGKRLLDHLVGFAETAVPVQADGYVLVTSELFSSAVACAR